MTLSVLCSQTEFLTAKKLKLEVQLPEPRYSSFQPGNTRSRAPSVSVNPPLSPGLESFSPPYTKSDNLGGWSAMRKENQIYPSGRVSMNLIPRASHDDTAETMERSQAEKVTLSDLYDPEDPFRIARRSVSPVSGFELPSTSTRRSPVPWNVDGSPSVLRSFSPPSFSTSARNLQKFCKPSGRFPWGFRERARIFRQTVSRIPSEVRVLRRGTVTSAERLDWRV